MIDTVNGKIRVRAWPRKRGKSKSPKQSLNNEKFAQTQRAFKWLAPEQQRYLIEATAHTPLLPRDVLTAMTFNNLMSFQLDNGKRIYPMTIRKQVSEALDTISQTEGQILIRGELGWSAITLATGGGWQEISRQVIAGGETEFFFNDLSQYSELRLVADAVATSLSTTRFFRVSKDNGATYLNGPGDYQIQSSAGALSATTAVILTSTSTNAPRTSQHHLFNQIDGSPAICNTLPSLVTTLIPALDSKITDIQIRLNSGVFNSGKFFLYGR